MRIEVKKNGATFFDSRVIPEERVLRQIKAAGYQVRIDGRALPLKSIKTGKT